MSSIVKGGTLTWLPSLLPVVVGFIGVREPPPQKGARTLVFARLSTSLLCDVRDHLPRARAWRASLFNAGLPLA